jgi:hypothetical protein
MAIPPKDDLEKDTIPLLLVRLSKIVADDPAHGGADNASKFFEEWSFLQTQPHPQSPTEKQAREAQVLALRKRIELFLKQN